MVAEHGQLLPAEEHDRGEVAFSSPLFNERSLFGAATFIS